MQTEQGRGLQVLKRLADDALERMPRDEARSFIDAMSATEFADALSAMSAAGVATDGETGGNLFYESAATRIRAADLAIAELKSEIDRLKSLRPLTNAEVQYGSPSVQNFHAETVRRMRVVPGVKNSFGELPTRAKRSTASRPQKAVRR